MREKLKDLPDDDLFELLETVSNEVKRRNGLLGPAVAPMDQKELQESLKKILEAMVRQ